MSIELTTEQKAAAWGLRAKLSLMISSMFSGLVANINTALATKADAEHEHDEYYTRTQIDSFLAGGTNFNIPVSVPDASAITLISSGVKATLTDLGAYVMVGISGSFAYTITKQPSPTHLSLDLSSALASLTNHATGSSSFDIPVQSRLISNSSTVPAAVGISATKSGTNVTLKPSTEFPTYPRTVNFNGISFYFYVRK